MASEDKKIIEFVEELNSHFSPRKTNFFLEINEGRILSIKLRALIHRRPMTTKKEEEINRKIREWSHGAMEVVNLTDGGCDISVNPLHRGYKARYVENTLKNLVKFLKIPQDV